MLLVYNDGKKVRCEKPMNHQRINSKSTHYSGITYHGTAFGAHFHNSYELICVLKGNITVTVNTRNLRLGEREFLLITPCMVHSIPKSKDATYFIAIITADYVPDFFESHKKNEAHLFSVDDDAFSYLKKHLFEGGKPNDYQLKACFYMMLSFADQGTGLPHLDSVKYDFILTVNAYIADHFTEPIRRAQLAELTGYEEHYFSSLFRKNFRLSLCQYINSHRISYALKLLCTTNMDICRIALECGFSSVKEFNNAFMRQMQETPSQYRKSNT